MDVLLRFFREKRKIQKSEEVDARQFVLFACMHLIFNDTGRIVFHAVAVEVVALLLNLNQYLFASVGRADNIHDAVLLAENSGELLHFKRDFLNRIAIVEVEHRVDERNEERMVLFFGKDNLKNAVAEDVGVVVNFLVLEKVLLIDFHCPEQGIMLCTIHLNLRF